MRKLIVTALLFSACGTWSNEDLEFLYALPDKETLHSQVPGEASAMQGVTRQPLNVGDDSTTYASTKLQADQFNAFLDEILTGLDGIRAIPPTTRMEDARIWGPYNDSSHPGFEVQVEIDRDGGHEFDWKISYRPQGGAFFDLGVGNFIPSQSLKEGKGGFFLDGKTAREQFDAGKAGDPDTVSVTYQTDRDPKMVGMDFVVPGDAGTGTLVYRYQQDDAGVTIANFAGTGSTDPNVSALDYTVGWDVSGQGRAHAIVTAGNYTDAGWDECWDSSFKVVYSSQNWPGGMSVGLPDACVHIDSF